MNTRGSYVLAKVLSVRRNFAFPCCIKCSGRVRTVDENILFCSICKQRYKEDDVYYCFRVNMTVSDSTQVSNVIIFGKCLECFFGTSATHFNRFINNLYVECKDLPIQVDELIQQCIEQCFIGSLVVVCYRGLPPCRTDSQLSRSSPIYLQNVQSVETNSSKPGHEKSSVHVVASHISRPGNAEKSPTVLAILKECLDSMQCSSEGSTFCQSPIAKRKCYELQKSLTKVTSSCRGSSKTPLTSCKLHVLGQCSPHSFNFIVSPLVLSPESDRSTCQSAVTTFSPFNNERLDKELISELNTSSPFDQHGSQNNTDHLSCFGDSTDMLYVNRQKDPCTDTVEHEHSGNDEHFAERQSLLGFIFDEISDSLLQQACQMTVSAKIKGSNSSASKQERDCCLHHYKLDTYPTYQLDSQSCSDLLYEAKKTSTPILFDNLDETSAECCMERNPRSSSENTKYPPADVEKYLNKTTRGIGLTHVTTPFKEQADLHWSALSFSCPETPMSFFASSTNSNLRNDSNPHRLDVTSSLSSKPEHSQIQQDSLLTSSLLECSFLN